MEKLKTGEKHEEESEGLALTVPFCENHASTKDSTSSFRRLPELFTRACKRTYVCNPTTFTVWIMSYSKCPNVDPITKESLMPLGVVAREKYFGAMAPGASTRPGSTMAIGNSLAPQKAGGKSFAPTTGQKGAVPTCRKLKRCCAAKGQKACIHNACIHKTYIHKAYIHKAHIHKAYIHKASLIRSMEECDHKQ